MYEQHLFISAYDDRQARLRHVYSMCGCTSIPFTVLWQIDHIEKMYGDVYADMSIAEFAEKLGYGQAS